jgi:hypothetical protein
MLKVQFYQTENGVEPVRKWLKEELTEEDRKIIGEDVKTVQEGFPMGMPLVRSLGSGLWEVRSNITGKRIARILFFHHAKRWRLSGCWLINCKSLWNKTKFPRLKWQAECTPAEPL